MKNYFYCIKEPWTINNNNCSGVFEHICIKTQIPEKDSQLFHLATHKSQMLSRNFKNIPDFIFYTIIYHLEMLFTNLLQGVLNKIA